MTLSLPADPSGAPRLTGVLPDAIAALDGGSARWPTVQSLIVFVVDGLGAANLAENLAYARFLAEHRGKKRVATSVFPSTTAAALTSLLTASDVGEHGLVGYRARDPLTGLVHNQLTDWGPRALDPLAWPQVAPLSASDTAHRWVVASKPEYAGTGFTEATLRGAENFGEKRLDDRVERAITEARSTPGTIVYLYAPELDAAGHRHGVASDRWTAALEAVDAAARRLHTGAGAGVGVIVTADHGMVDVPRHRQIVMVDGDPRLEAAAVIAGEPRMLHLYAHPGADESLIRAWRDEPSAWVFTREEAIAAGLFGDAVSAEVAARIGDVMVAARGRVAYYDGRLTDTSAQHMVGQHGSLTTEERVVPLIGLGGFAD
ncbi:alkaline phosphatase family protein [Microbacterium binotii]|uniref:alkaline phosphatase family protein n=1 Tax=Microbacterium binotii TaxID=462710 RepID=UPI001F41C8B9|nr:alkaline phosphatase family protein [Microbacterium binotii]UIN29313.1 alkaline phosphatase family protein [Microbacterium binotii]